ncbi:MAG TPA: glycosyltransferase family 4 protein [Thermoleophilaceae bacterium]|nr:glycosyltransferase family 4 protein [Thermoleophilaceae bacterium]
MSAHAGAPGATRALGAALERAGCEVEYLGFEQAFPRSTATGLRHSIEFPWRVARLLAKQARRFDVVDASLGDTWVWGTLGRPRAGRSHALIARSHGLEHVVDRAVRAAARAEGPPLSRRYPVYHGGYRLWEVARSMRLSDRCVLLNEEEREYAAGELGIPRERLVVLPNGVDDRFHAAAPAKPVDGGPVRLAFVGSWIPRKGTATLARALERLSANGVEFRLSVLGCGDESAARADLPSSHSISILPAYRNEELPSLLAGHELLLFPSRSEGASVALLEAMACGLAPIATSVGAAPEVITGENGVLVDVGDADALADNVARLAADRGALNQMRRAAQATAGGYRWHDIAQRTVRLYEQALASGR